MKKPPMLFSQTAASALRAAVVGASGSSDSGTFGGRSGAACSPCCTSSAEQICRAPIQLLETEINAAQVHLGIHAWTGPLAVQGRPVAPQAQGVRAGVVSRGGRYASLVTVRLSG